MSIHLKNLKLMSNKALIIFVKNPELGKVKTRIARTAGDEKALRIYLELMKHTRQIALESSVDLLLFYSQEINTKDDWSNEQFTKHLQVETDLGGRMKAAFQKAFEDHDKVVIIGSDCASLNAEIIKNAFTALEDNSFVIGPTFDGGYYLLGMKQFEPSVFDDIQWSTDEVFPKTIERIQTLNAAYHLAPQLSDIDFEEDWEKYGWALTEVN